MDKQDKSTSDVLEGVVRDNRNDRISLLEIKTALHERGFAILMVFFALPVCIPAVAAIPAIPLILFSIQMIKGMDSPWIPNWVGKKTISRQTLAYMVEKASSYLRKAEHILTPRFSFASSSKGEKLIGFFSLIFSISILLPIPLGNIVPALGILLMSLGLLSKDGLVIIIGMIVGCIGVAMATLVVLIGSEAISWISGLFFG
jgi:hypothetical protein